MVDGYIILNRKPSLIIKAFTFNILVLLILVIWGINTLSFYSFFHIHSQILNLNNSYYLEVLIPAKEVKTVTNNKKIFINTKEYQYRIYEVEPKIVYENNQNYQRVYLEIYDLEESYKINGYQLEVKIEKDKKKIIDYLKNKKEEI